MSDVLPGVLVIAMTGDYRNFKAATKRVGVARTATEAATTLMKIITSGFAGHSRPPSRTEAGGHRSRSIIQVLGVPALDLPGPKYQSSPPIQ
jgi:hypothetical protein